jgi:hypothetical protein
MPYISKICDIEVRETVQADRKYEEAVTIVSIQSGCYSVIVTTGL